MCTYNGEKYIKDQLRSIEAQTYTDWELWISDDGSTDATLRICEEFKKNRKNKNNVYLLKGPRKGFSSNFLSLVGKVEGNSKYFCFADQDDIWLEDKIDSGVKALDGVCETVPALYCGRTELVNDDGARFNPKRFSRLHKSEPSFRNALVQSIASGNTMIFNRAARAKLLEVMPTTNIPSHDWWAYIVISGSDGKVIYDPTPHLLYRQHADNVIGDNSGIRATLKRLAQFLDGRFKLFNNENTSALEQNLEVLTQVNKETFLNFKRARSGGLCRFCSLYKSGVRRDGLTNIGLWIGCLINKI